MNVSESAFKAYDIRGKVGSELTNELAQAVGRALADFLPKEGPVAVGRDMRTQSAELAENVRLGLMAQGRQVWDIGMVTSDMSYFAVGHYGLAGAAMITASHNDSAYNGIKLYRDEVRPIGLDSGLADIREAIKADSYKPALEMGETTEKDIVADWIAHALSFLGDTKLPNWNIAIDAGNGMAGAILPQLKDKLPLVITPMYYELDGTFPNHDANPEDLNNLADLVARVSGKLDFGIAFDGDGDRAVLVDDLGRPINGSDIISLIAGMYLKSNPGAPIVYDVRTSRATEELITEWGGQPIRTKAGRVGIGEKMREVDAPFGGETTGHLFFRDNYFADSGLIGALAAMRALAETGGKLSTIIDTYHRYSLEPEENFTVSDADATLDKLAAKYADAKQSDLDGLTVEYPEWWFNLRKSNTELVVRLNIEAKDAVLLEAKRAEVLALIQDNPSEKQ